MPNLFDDLPDHLPNELVEGLVAAPHVRIERIVSTGQASPDGFWYDQSEAEFVVLLRGSAALRFEDEDSDRQLEPGDWLRIDAHRRHRVVSTAADQPTVWLAVFYDPD